MSAAAVSGRLSPQPLDPNAVLSRGPNPATAKNPGKPLSAKPLPPPPSQAASPKTYSVRAATTEEQKSKEELLRNYIVTHAQLEIVKQKQDELAKGMAADKAKIAEYDCKLAADRAKIAECDTKLAADRAKIAECDRILKECDEKKAQDQARIDQRNREIAADKAKIAENNVAIAASNARINDSERNMIKGCLAKFFSTDLLTITSTFSQSTLDLLTANMTNQCLIIDEIGMDKIVISYLKNHKNVTFLNLALFKDQMKGNSLFNLLNILPETGISSIKFAKKLSEAEIAQIKATKDAYAKLGRTLTVV